MSSQKQQLLNSNSNTNTTPEYILSLLNEINSLLPPEIQQKLMSPLQEIIYYLANQCKKQLLINNSEEKILAQDVMSESRSALQKIKNNISFVEYHNSNSQILIPILLKMQQVINYLNQNQSMSLSSFNIQQEINLLHNILKQISMDLQKPQQNILQFSFSSSSSEELKKIQQNIEMMAQTRNDLLLQKKQIKSEKPNTIQTPINDTTNSRADRTYLENSQIQNVEPLQSNYQEYKNYSPSQIEKVNIILYDPYISSSILNNIQSLISSLKVDCYSIFENKKQNTIQPQKSNLFSSEKKLTFSKYLTYILQVLENYQKNNLKNFVVVSVISVEETQKEQDGMADNVFRFVMNLKKKNINLEINFIELQKQKNVKIAIKEINDMKQQNITAKYVIDKTELNNLFKQQQHNVEQSHHNINFHAQQIQECKQNTFQNIDKMILKNNLVQQQNQICQKNFDHQQEMEKNKQQKLQILRNEMEELDKRIELELQRMKNVQQQLEYEQIQFYNQVQREVNIKQTENQEIQRRLDLIKNNIENIVVSDKQFVQDQSKEISEDFQMLFDKLVDLQVGIFPSENSILFVKYALDAKITPLKLNEGSIQDLVVKNILQKNVPQEYIIKLSSINLQVFLQSNVYESFAQSFQNDQDFLNLLITIQQCFYSLKIIQFFQNAVFRTQIDQSLFNFKINEALNLQQKLTLQI